MFKAIKRLSAEYRKHEKEIEEIKLNQSIEAVKMVLALTTNILQMQIIAKQPIKSEGLEVGGIIPVVNSKMVNGEIIEHPIPISKEIAYKLKSDLEKCNKESVNFDIKIDVDKINSLNKH